MTERAVDADLGDQREDHVLGGDSLGERAAEIRAHRFGLGDGQRLRDQHVFDVRRADPPCPSAQRPQRGRVRIPAHDGQPRQRQAELRPDHVHDALIGIADVEIAEAVLGRRRAQRADHLGAARHGFVAAAGFRRHDMVGRGESEFAMTHAAPLFAHRRESLRARHVVDQMAVDMDEQPPAVQAAHDVRVAELGEERARAHSAANRFSASQ